MNLELSRVFSRRLTGFDLMAESGIHVVLGAPADGAAELMEIAAGVLKPASGRVRVAGAAPFSSPEARRRLATLLFDEELPPGRTVSDAIRCVLGTRSDPRSQEDVLARFGLLAWATRSPATLGFDERRSVAAALALGHVGASVMVLAEPLALRGIERGHVVEAISAAAERGATVLTTTANVRDAIELGGMTHWLERGRINRSLPAAQIDSLLPGSPVRLVAHCSDVRRLAARLTGDPDVFSIGYDLGREPGRLVVEGADPSRVALSLLRASRETGVELEAVMPRTPPLEVARAANTALVRAAYDNAYRSRQTASDAEPARARPDPSRRLS